MAQLLRTRKTWMGIIVTQGMLKGRCAVTSVTNLCVTIFTTFHALDDYIYKSNELHFE
jgi:hypothetical protein